MQHLFLFTRNKQTFQRVRCVCALCVLSCRTCWVAPSNRALSAGLGLELLRYLFYRGQISAECILTPSPLSPVPCDCQCRWRTSQRQPQAPRGKKGQGRVHRCNHQPPPAAQAHGAAAELSLLFLVSEMSWSAFLQAAEGQPCWLHSGAAKKGEQLRCLWLLLADCPRGAPRAG